MNECMKSYKITRGERIHMQITMKPRMRSETTVHGDSVSVGRESRTHCRILRKFMYASFSSAADVIRMACTLSRLACSAVSRTWKPFSRRLCCATSCSSANCSKWSGTPKDLARAAVGIAASAAPVADLVDVIAKASAPPRTLLLEVEWLRVDVGMPTVDMLPSPLPLVPPPA